MNKPLNPDRVRQLRLSQRLSQEGLAKKAGLSKESIYRLERGRQPGNRQKTQDGLMKAFAVELDVLTGDVPPSPTSLPEESADGGDRYQLNYRVGGHVHNAYSLAARRYGVPIARIVELAPFLFVLAAEESLARRRRKLGELEARVHPYESLRQDFPHLPDLLVMNFEAAEALEAEEASIAARDILADEHDATARDNPFVLYLKEASAADADVASIESFDRYSVDFSVCRGDALKLAGGDGDLAARIVNGFVMLNKMPRDLFADDATDARVAWLREKVDAHIASLFALLDDL